MDTSQQIIVRLFIPWLQAIQKNGSDEHEILGRSLESMRALKARSDPWPVSLENCIIFLESYRASVTHFLWAHVCEGSYVSPDPANMNYLKNEITALANQFSADRLADLVDGTVSDGYDFNAQILSFRNLDIVAREKALENTCLMENIRQLIYEKILRVNLLSDQNRGIGSHLSKQEFATELSRQIDMYIQKYLLKAHS